jgi:hypothetical protein
MKLGAASEKKAIMRRGNLIGQGQPKAHGVDGGSRNRGWLLAQGFDVDPQNSLNGQR